MAGWLQLPALTELSLVLVFPVLLLAEGGWRVHCASGKRSQAVVWWQAALWVAGSRVFAAVVLGYLGTVVQVNVARDREDRAKAVCSSRLMALAAATLAYAADHGDRLPAVRTWENEILVSSTGDGRALCPTGRGYAYNAAVAGAAVQTVPANTVLLFETVAGSSASGGADLLPDLPGHLGGDNYAFADGHVVWVMRKKVGQDARGQPIWAKEPDADWVKWEP
jgi:prepilin-type processing-associated H-X9-DG protein